MNDTEQRRSFRVRETVYLRYETLSDLDFSEGLERRRLRHGLGARVASAMADLDARIGTEMQRLNADSSPVARCLSLLNDKLNVVVQQMPELQKLRTELANTTPQVCELSADGIVFSSSQPVPLGTKLLVEFLLESDNRFVDAFATVIREVPPPDSGNPNLQHGVAVAFHDMKPELRETLIQHMFSRESETLRMRRLQLDSH